MTIDLQAARRQFSHQPTQREGARPAPFGKPGAMRASNLPRLVPAHLPRRHAAELANTLGPVDRGARRHIEQLGRPSA
jgi:hypothetical protein